MAGYKIWLFYLLQEDGDDLLLKAEKENRQKVSGVLQRLLLLFRAARCSFPAAQWYLLRLRRAHKVMQKVWACSAYLNMLLFINTSNSDISPRGPAL